MKLHHRIILSLTLAVFFLIAGIILQNKSYQALDKIVPKNHIESVLQNKQKFLHAHFHYLTQNDIISDSVATRQYIKAQSSRLKAAACNLFIFKDSSLTHWSNRETPSPDSIRNVAALDIKKLSNGWYYIVAQDYGKYHLIGTYLIKHEYSYENPFLSTEFNPELHIENPNIYISKTETNYSVGIGTGWNASFWLSTDRAKLCAPRFRNLSALSFFFCLIFVLAATLFAYKLVWNRFTPGNWLILLLIADLFLVRGVIYYFNFPSVWFDLDLFSPKYYAGPILNASLGELSLNSLLFLCFAWVFYSHFRLKKSSGSVIWQFAKSLLIHSIIFSLFVGVYFIFKNLIINSSIPLEFHALLQLTPYSFISLVVISIILLGVLLIIARLYRENIKQSEVKWIILSMIPALSAFILLVAFSGSIALLVAGLVLALAIGIMLYLRLKNRQINYYTCIIISLILAAAVSIVAEKNARKRELEQRKVIAMNLANERDAGAEYFIKQMNSKIRRDPSVPVLIDTANYESLYQYFNDKFMGGYLSKYDFQFSLCFESDSLIIQPDEISVNCQNFFNELIKEKGIILPGSDFYYLDNNNGRISYLGKLELKYKGKRLPVLYIEVDSKIVSEGLGYPELLLQESLMPKKYQQKYSQAKYYKNSLIAQQGSFEYPAKYQFPKRTKEEFLQYYKGDYEHLVYFPDKQNVIVLSKAATRFTDYLIAFSYIFFIYFILVNLAFVFRAMAIRKWQKSDNASLKNRIQFYFISFTSLAFIIIAAVSIYFNIQKYREKQFENLEDKLQSIEVELKHKLGAEPQLSQDMQSYLTYLLVKFSNVFYTDINLYSTDGQLLASSRPEIYKKGLIGKRIIPEAMDQLVKNKTGHFIQEENIGKMDYLSAYKSFRNDQNRELAYINLPYFAKENQFSEEVSSLVMAILNVYLVLFLVSILLSVIISNRLTKPLRLIQENLRRLEIGKRGKKLKYSRKDELGNLISEYNRKVDELIDSSEKLARSEREYAWREMAKQIAHEIKNPLTPMKLSVQHLESAYKNNDPSLDKLIDNVCHTLIEQIDSLSNIATEFSNFAKIRMGNREDVNLAERINHVYQLFKGSTDVDILIEKDTEQAIVKANKEQIMRILNNLVKNALQAIPEGRNGKIRIWLKTLDKHYQIAVKDNGSGIPESMHYHIFTPNFTTKGSGMGLGLSIAKGITQHFDGRIYFETTEGKGSVFFIELPKAEMNKG